MSASVFPARAGMSPSVELFPFSFASVPRASGDEPLKEAEAATGSLCSPRERG